MSEWEYQTDKAVLIPYVAQRTDIFPETFLASLYQKITEDGTKDVTFPGMTMDSMNQFVSYMSRRTLVMFHFKDANGIVGAPFGYAWICEMEGCDGARKASFGFGIFREYWGRIENRHACAMMIYWWFKELRIDVLYATTMQQNHLARNFSRNFSFKVIGRMPKFFYKDKKLTDGILMVLEREDYLPLYEEWRAKIGA